MLLAAHSITGGYLGSQVESLTVAFIIGIISHFILDAIPHYDTTDNGRFTKRQIFLIGLDLIIVALILLHINQEFCITNSYIAGIVGGLAPDILDNVPFWKNSFRKTKLGYYFHYLHNKIHQKQPGIFSGLAIQVLIVLSFYFLSIKK